MLELSLIGFDATREPGKTREVENRGRMPLLRTLTSHRGRMPLLRVGNLKQHVVNQASFAEPRRRQHDQKPAVPVGRRQIT